MTALTPAERRRAVNLLAVTGLSSRAIGDVVGAAQATVVRDLREAPDFAAVLGPSPTEFMKMVDQPGVAGAVERSAQIRAALGANDWDRALPLIAASYRDQDWRALGQRSWLRYCAVHLGLGGPRKNAANLGPRSVYFVQPVDGGPIKIGIAANVASRLSGLQTGSPVELRVLGIIPGVRPSREAELHERFASTRKHGEWFEPTPELMAYIAVHAEVPR